MRLPLVVVPRLTTKELNAWRTYYRSADRRREEGLWRRTQSPLNAGESGWRGPQDARRRMVHYRHCYDVLRKGGAPTLCLVDTFVWIHYCLPLRDVASIEARVLRAAREAGWARVGSRMWRRGSLTLEITARERHPEDERVARSFPSGYGTLDVEVRSGTAEEYDGIRRRPWFVLNSGFRKPDVRGAPRLNPPVAEIVAYLPGQVELGCGPSIEAGIPPLYHLHEVYQVTEGDSGMCCFGTGRDVLAPMLVRQPQRAYRRFVEMFTRCFTASPTGFHHMLRELHRQGVVVGPILTNNFDGLPSRAGLPEMVLRRYDELVPPISFHPDARSLLVVGSHADRRRIRRRARERGLKVIYIDPEGYTVGETFRPYRLEGPQSDDIVWQEGATAAFNLLAVAIKDRQALGAVAG